MPGDVQEKKALQVEIERILPGGVGLAHAEGLTLFVPLTAPGDVVRVELSRVRGNVAFASLVEVIRSSSLRTEPPCPYFGRCGGCDFQQLTYEAQLEAKVEIIRDCLRRIAQLEPPSEIPIHASPRQWQYRARTNWQLDSQTKHLGYFEAGSHRVCDVEVCAVLVPELQKTLEIFRHRLANELLPKEIEAVAGDQEISVVPPLPPFVTREVRRVVEGDTYRFDAASFFQINHDLLAPLVQAAVQEKRGTLAIDLYCGVGLFTLPLARHFEHVIGVEANSAAADFARRNLAEANLPNAEIITSRVSDWLEYAAPGQRAAHFALLDPPRAGVEDKGIEGLLAMRPSRISYVSCDPATLARDLRKLLADGYLLDSLVAFDMFPQTHHVETVARLVYGDT